MHKYIDTNVALEPTFSYECCKLLHVVDIFSLAVRQFAAPHLLRVHSKFFCPHNYGYRHLPLKLASYTVVSCARLPIMLGVPITKRSTDQPWWCLETDVRLTISIALYFQAFYGPFFSFFLFYKDGWIVLNGDSWSSCAARNRRGYICGLVKCRFLESSA